MTDLSINDPAFKHQDQLLLPTSAHGRSVQEANGTDRSIIVCFFETLLSHSYEALYIPSHLIPSTQKKYLPEVFA